MGAKNASVIGELLDALLCKIDLVPAVKLRSSVVEMLGYVKILELEQHHPRVPVSSWLGKVWKAAHRANHLLDPSNSASLSPDVVHQLWSTFTRLLKERKEPPEIQSQTLDVDEVNGIFGREQEIERISSWVVQEEHFSSLCIHGEEAVGKTFLARYLFNDEMVMNHFKTRAWVWVCDEVDLVSVGRGIVKSLSGLSCVLNDLTELDAAVRDMFHCSRTLIVLDNIQLMQERAWLHMVNSWFCSMDSGSKVVLTSSSPSNKVPGMTDDQLELGRLSHDASWSLFSSFAFDASEFDDLHQRITSHARARAIASHCLGNPLLLKIWGSLLRLARDTTEGFLVRHFDCKKDVRGMLQLSYSCLPDPLKQCLGFCILYPKGHTFNIDWLIQMSNLHVLIPPAEEDEALAYFHQLLPFLADVIWDDNGDFTDFRLPGLIHELLEDITGVISCHEDGLVSRFSKSGCQTYLEFTTESLTIPEVTSIFNAQQLQTLVVSGNYLGNLSSCISRFKSVTFLKLSGTGISKLTTHIDTLKQLKYLDLSDTLISRLPDSVTNLIGLQTLKLSGCHNLRTLPRNMQSLINLRCLEIELCDSLLYLPSGIGKLERLQSISSFVLGHSDKCARLSELGSFKQLKGKLAIKNLENVRSIAEAQEAKLHEKKDIEHLKLSWKDASSKVPCKMILQVLVPHTHLKSLYIRGYSADKFPIWVQRVYSLTKITIKDCQCEELPPLGQLPNLKKLLLEGISKIKAIGTEFYGDSGFHSLEHLELRDMPSLVNWVSFDPSEERAKPFPLLKTLTIEACNELTRMPYFPALEGLIISDSSNSILSCLPDIQSLASLVMKNILIKVSFENVSRSMSACNLIIDDCPGDLGYLMGRDIVKFTSLTHLGLFSCDGLRFLDARYLNSLQKLDLVDCCNLISFKENPAISSLKELTLDGCLTLELLPKSSHFTTLEKLTIKRCAILSALPEDDEMLLQLKSLIVSGCPMLQKKLQMDTAEARLRYSHIDRLVILS